MNAKAHPKAKKATKKVAVDSEVSSSADAEFCQVPPPDPEYDALFAKMRALPLDALLAEVSAGNEFAIKVLGDYEPKVTEARYANTLRAMAIRLKGPRTVEGIIRALADRSRRFRVDLDVLVGLAEGPGVPVSTRVAAIEALADFPADQKRAEMVIGNLLRNDPAPEIRIAAIQAVGSFILSQPELMELVKLALKDPHPLVREQAARTIEDEHEFMKTMDEIEAKEGT